MIAIGGVIGAGLFVGSGVVIRATGPAAFLTYALCGALIVLVMRMLGEMAAANPSTGAFADYAAKALGGWAGFSVGWLYWYFWVIVVGFEAVAGLTDPIYGLGPRIAQLVAGAFFREPKQVVELDRDGDKIDLGGISVNIDHTPGHTRGSVVFRVLQATNNDKDIVFTGDTLFERAIGRTDLAGGSGRDLLRSIVDKLLVLDDSTVVLPGHGNSTTIGAERRFNPFLEGLSR